MTKYTGGVIEQAARVLAGLKPGEDWPTNEWRDMSWSDTGGSEPTDEYQLEMFYLARDLDAAGLLARPLPTRDEIADVLYDSLKEEGWISITGYYPYEVADAVLDLLKGTQE